MEQSCWIEQLKDPGCYPHPVERIRVIETHISWVILTGPYAYKIKKPVTFSFLDFATLEQRRAYCEEEIRLNTRLAPTVYLGVVPITGTSSHPHMDGAGEPFEFAVKMRQFDSEQELHHLLQRGACDASLMDAIAGKVGHFHLTVAVADFDSPYGTPESVWKPVAECLSEISPTLMTPSLREQYDALKVWCEREWRRLQSEFAGRKLAGWIRECHGDLHFGNMALVEGDICIFDALEFDPRLRWIDVMSEVAFLVMDAIRHKRPDLAYGFLNRYLEITGDYEGIKVLRFYMVYRALVRAKVAGLRLNQLPGEHGDWKDGFNEWEGYVRLAIQLSQSSLVCVMLMHGVSGTGKTTISTHLLRALGAVRIRSDVERRRLVEAGSGERQVEDAYTPAITGTVYTRLCRLAEIIVSAGYPVIIDATFLRRGRRRPFIRLAQEHSIPIRILEITAPEAIRMERIERRLRAGSDASEATVPVMRTQMEQDESFDEEERALVISIDSTDDQSVEAAVGRLARLNPCTK